MYIYYLIGYIGIVIFHYSKLILLVYFISYHKLLTLLIILLIEIIKHYFGTYYLRE